MARCSECRLREDCQRPASYYLTDECSDFEKDSLRSEGVGEEMEDKRGRDKRRS